MKNELKMLLKKYTALIKECQGYLKPVAKKGDYRGCIELEGNIKAYKNIVWDLKKSIERLPG